MEKKLLKNNQASTLLELENLGDHGLHNIEAFEESFFFRLCFVGSLPISLLLSALSNASIADFKSVYSEMIVNVCY